MLFAAREVRIDRGRRRRITMARRLSAQVRHRRWRPPGLLDRAKVSRHRDLLKQQTEQREQRDPAMVATAIHLG